MWWADGGPRKTYCCADQTTCTTGPGHGCRMKPLSTTRKLCVLRHAPSLCVLPPNQSLLSASPDSPLATVLCFCQISGTRCRLLRFAASLRCTLTPHLPTIEFAYGPRPPQPRAASFSQLN